MNKGFVRRARNLSVAGTAVILLGLTASACSPAPTPHSSVPAPLTFTPVAPTATTAAPTNTPAAPQPTGEPAPAKVAEPAQHQPVPTLGRVWAPHQHGYGTVRPSLIDNGGDGMGVVTGIRWQSWGGPVAIGSGTAGFVRDGQPFALAVPEQATVEAWNPGICEGKLMYRSLDWFFPGEGEKLDKNHYLDVCAGTAN